MHTLSKAFFFFLPSWKKLEDILCLCTYYTVCLSQLFTFQKYCLFNLEGPQERKISKHCGWFFFFLFLTLRPFLSYVPFYYTIANEVCNRLGLSIKDSFVCVLARSLRLQEELSLLNYSLFLGIRSEKNNRICNL